MCVPWILRSSHCPCYKNLLTIWLLLLCFLLIDGSLRMTPWSCTLRMLGKLWKLWLTRGTVKLIHIVVVVFFSGFKTCLVAATQRDRHQLAAPGRAAEEEIPAPGVQRHRILKKRCTWCSYYTVWVKRLTPLLIWWFYFCHYLHCGLSLKASKLLMDIHGIPKKYKMTQAHFIITFFTTLCCE